MMDLKLFFSKFKFSFNFKALPDKHVIGHSAENFDIVDIVQ